MLLGDILDICEDVNIEYKEFCFKMNIFEHFSKSNLRSIINTGNFCNKFNNTLLKNILTYFNIYIPRYASAFHNTKSHETYHFYIGINDTNEITGIPFNGNLLNYESFFNTYIHNILQNNINCVCCLNIDLEIKKLDTDSDIFDDEHLTELLRKYDTQNIQYKSDYNEYIMKKKQWISLLFLYKGKLQNVINDKTVKLEFIKYLETNNLLECFPEVYQDNHIIPLEDIKFMKIDKTSMVYWLIKYKDEKISELMKIKPKEPSIPKILNLDYCLITKLTYLRKRFIMNNIDYFMIHLKFNCRRKCKNVISFIDKRNKINRTMKRLHGGICINV